jgi:hypothetical protein
MKKHIGIVGILGALALTGCASASGIESESTRRTQDAGVRGALIGGAGATSGSDHGSAGEVTVRTGPDVIENERAVAVPLTQAWGALVGFLSDEELPVGFADARNGVAEIRGRLPRLDRKRMSYWVDCGSTIRGDVADGSYIDVVIRVQLQPLNASSTGISTEFVAQAQPRDNQTARIPCQSRGTLETWIAEQVQERVATQ